MICILKHGQSGELTGWIIAEDVADARNLAGAAQELDLTNYLYTIDSLHPPHGKHVLPVPSGDGSTYMMLV